MERDMALRRLGWWPALAALLALVAGCAGPHAPFQKSQHPHWVGWSEQVIPGKSSTRYKSGLKDGRPALHARADRSASMFRRAVNAPAGQLRELTFSWWLDSHLMDADIAKAGATDAPVRVMVAFGGDIGALPLKARMMFDLASALTGEEPPYATLVYVWDKTRPVGEVLHHPRTDRVRKIVVESGDANLGTWRQYRRDFRADFRLAFGEDPGPILGVMVMTDSDNTASSTQAWYGPVALN
jgi:Protein of unknown function (DUF3047)